MCIRDVFIIPCEWRLVLFEVFVLGSSHRRRFYVAIISSFSFDTTNFPDTSFPVLLRKQSLVYAFLLDPPNTASCLLCEQLGCLHKANYALAVARVCFVVQIQMRWFTMMCPEKTQTPTQVSDVFPSFCHYMNSLNLVPVSASQFHFRFLSVFSNWRTWIIHLFTVTGTLSLNNIFLFNVLMRDECFGIYSSCVAQLIKHFCELCKYSKLLC